MNARFVTVIVGAIICLLGLAGLFYPGHVMGLLGMLPLNPSHAAAARGEVRATYGGLFVVMGVYTLLAALDPAAHRGRLLFVGLLWLGACAGRLFGAYADGNPGLPSWLAAGFELLIGGVLLAATLRRAPSAAGSGPDAVPPSA